MGTLLKSLLFAMAILSIHSVGSSVDTPEEDPMSKKTPPTTSEQDMDRVRQHLAQALAKLSKTKPPASGPVFTYPTDTDNRVRQRPDGTWRILEGNA